MYKSFYLEILTPDRDFFRGEVESLIIRTPGGKMGILYQTMPMVTTIAAGLMRFSQKGVWKEAFASEGFIEVRAERVVILLQSAEWPYEINISKVNDEIDAAEATLRKAQSLREYKIAKAQLARQFAKLKVRGGRGGLD